MGHKEESMKVKELETRAFYKDLIQLEIPADELDQVKELIGNFHSKYYQDRKISHNARRSKKRFPQDEIDCITRNILDPSILVVKTSWTDAGAYIEMSPLLARAVVKAMAPLRQSKRNFQNSRSSITGRGYPGRRLLARLAKASIAQRIE